MDYLLYCCLVYAWDFVRLCYFFVASGRACGIRGVIYIYVRDLHKGLAYCAVCFNSISNLFY